ncbi:hypothetical protein CAEBREN_25055 [Caenorhabditis brenneri]|uniref:Serine/threonine-protein phosphatase 4 regulatory subunit 1 n=1 Tax=Caenorhabditis brenneri TaxID=135651 RepID=G0MMB2_CAEBE|nr:hypothetical protein CAEBREN_25055 [Caenorhabditis brenneri]
MKRIISQPALMCLTVFSDEISALCQVIQYDTIHDRRWLFENFLPKFSQMLKDPTMHVRKFLVPHLITLSCDMTWAVRKVACEIFVKVSECASVGVRVETLAPNFMRLLNDPNKWVSFIAYQQLGPFISLFANPSVTGIELKNGQLIVRDIVAPSSTDNSLADTPITIPQEELNEARGEEASFTIESNSKDEFGTLPPNTWLPEAEIADDFEYQIAMNEIAVSAYHKEVANVTPTTAAKTPKRGERVMDSVLSGINKMFGPFERSSPKAKETEKIAATFSSPSKRSPLSLHGAVSLMDKWSKRTNPNNPQRFPVFDSSSSSSDPSSPSNSSNKLDQKLEGGTGIAAKCNSTDDLTKLGLEDDVSTTTNSAAAAAAASAAERTPEKGSSPSSSSETRFASPRGRRIATNAWSKMNIGQKLFLRRLGALPPTSAISKKKVLSPRLSPTRSPTRPKSSLSKRRAIFEFAPPTEIIKLVGPEVVLEQKTDEKASSDEEEKEEIRSDSRRTQYIDKKDESAEDSDSEDEPDFDKSFVADEEEDEEDTPLTIEIKSGSMGSTESVAQDGVKEPVSNEFSLTYWSSNYAIDAIEDELKPFGSSSSFTNSPTSNSYLESRFDVMKAANGSCSPRSRSQSFGTNGSPIALSPRRKANSTCEAPNTPSPPTTASLDTSKSENSKSDDSTVMLNTEEKEKLGILDIDDLNMSLSSNSSVQGEAAMTEESDISMISLENSVFQHVPIDLVEAYMKVMGPPGQQGTSVATGDASLCAEIYRHCAHNFPAVCYTLGRAAWPKLRLVFRKLASDEQSRVRQSISYSIHEIAVMLGQEITDEDLLPIFYELRNDQNVEVRAGILTHLYDFVKCLSSEKRDEMILSLPQFFPIGAQPGNQAQNGDWRSRYELISQLSKLCSLYSTNDVNFHMSGIALTLADDRVAEVRREAVLLVSTIVGALVSAEWDEIRVNRDIDSGHLDVKSKREKAKRFLSEQFVDDIVSSFAKTQKWTRRQTFCFICAQILKDKQCDGIQFRYFFATSLQQLVTDKVANVRLASCEALSVWRKTLIAARSQDRRGQSPISSPSSEPTTLRRDINMVSDMMVKLANDSDVDAAYLAKKCQGLTDDQQPVDVEARTARMREREELYFGDVIITDSAGCLVRMVGKDVKQVIRTASTPLVTPAPVETAPPVTKMVPIEKPEEYDEDLLTQQTEAMDITEPPEMTADVVQIIPVTTTNSEGEDELKDNTDVVDMEIDEDEEVDPSKEQKMETEQKEEEEEGSSDAVAPTAASEVKQKISEVVKTTTEGDVPMDPAPSAPMSPKEEATTPTSSSPTDSEA